MTVSAIIPFSAVSSAVYKSCKKNREIIDARGTDLNEAYARVIHAADYSDGAGAPYAPAPPAANVFPPPPPSYGFATANQNKPDGERAANASPQGTTTTSGQQNSGPGPWSGFLAGAAAGTAATYLL